MASVRFAPSRAFFCLGLLASTLVACGGGGSADLRGDGTSSGATPEGTSSGSNASGGTSPGGNASGGTSSGGSSSGEQRPPIPSDTDGIKNGDESDVDCGGSTGVACADGKGCTGLAECSSRVCKEGVCQVPSPTDGQKNGDETARDCGGNSAPACADRSACLLPRDCTSKLCTDNVCQTPTPADGEQNGQETGVDCGGPVATPCADLLGCALPRDCVSRVCAGNVCQAPLPDDGQQNGDETGPDCGGERAGACADLLGCALPRDCVSKVCTGGLCQRPLPNDGQQNGQETDVDCGGPVAARCAVDQVCAIGDDCDSRFCTGARCEPRKAGRKDGDETDVDCGGLLAAACDWDKVCSLDRDCTSGACVGGACLTGPSCRQHNGGDTCGSGEDPPRDGVQPSHQTCCRSLPVTGYADPRPAFAGKTVYLDKYEITAGRMREFLRVVGAGGEPNVRAYMAANRPARWDARWEEVLPTSNYAGSTFGYTITNPTTAAQKNYFPGQDVFAPTNGDGGWYVQPGDYTIFMGVYRALGAPHLFPEFRSTQQDKPDYSASHAMNCGNQPGSYGLSTYHFPANVVSDARYSDGIGKYFSQEQMDQKALNCSPSALYAAFCAWDGGQLATTEVVDFVTANNTRLVFTGTDCKGTGNVGINASDDGGTACYQVYYYPFHPVEITYDDSSRIAPPGRVPADVVRLQANGEAWNDLNGNLAEITLAADGRFARRGFGLGWGSVANHHQLQISLPRFKGSAFGARCMRFK